jgi:aerobic C4-dicarboxylate transport protein
MGETPKKKAFWKGMGFQVAVSVALGVICGMFFPELGAKMKPLGDIFLKLIKTVVAPLVFLTVATGIAAVGDLKRVGKTGVIAAVYFEVISTIAILWGLATATLLGVGKGVGRIATDASLQKGAASAEAAAAQVQHTDKTSFFLNMFPDNFVGAFTKTELLPVLVLALIFGAAILRLSPAKRAPIESGLASISNAFFEFTHIIMQFAPIGAFGAIAYTVGSNGRDILIVLAQFMLAYWSITLGFVLVVMGGVCLVFRLNLFDIIRYIKDEILIVLGTGSSESILPRLLEKLPAYGVSKQSVGLVLPTSYVFNLDGAHIYLAACTIFLANVFDVHPSFTQYVTMFGVMMVTAKGGAAVAGGAFVILAATVTMTGILPVEGLPILFGVYRIMAPANAICNAVSNSVACIVVAKLSGEYDPSARRPAPEIA